MSLQTFIGAVVVLLIIVAVAAVVVAVVLHDKKVANGPAPVPGCCCQNGNPTTTGSTDANADCDVPHLWTSGACSVTSPPTCATAWYNSRSHTWSGSFTVVGANVKTRIYNLTGHSKSTPVWKYGQTKWQSIANVGYPRPGDTVAVAVSSTVGTTIPVAFSTITFVNNNIIKFT